MPGVGRATAGEWPAPPSLQPNLIRKRGDDMRYRVLPILGIVFMVALFPHVAVQVAQTLVGALLDALGGLLQAAVS